MGNAGSLGQICGFIPDKILHSAYLNTHEKLTLRSTYSNESEWLEQHLLTVNEVTSFQPDIQRTNILFSLKQITYFILSNLFAIQKNKHITHLYLFFKLSYIEVSHHRNISCRM